MLTSINKKCKAKTSLLDLLRITEDRSISIKSLSKHSLRVEHISTRSGSINSSSSNSGVDMSNSFRDTTKPKQITSMKGIVFKQSLKYKTEMCKNFVSSGNCTFGVDCCFAHSTTELRIRTNLSGGFKTKICRRFHKHGLCNYGSRCQYSHFKNGEEYQALLMSVEQRLIAKLQSTHNISLYDALQINKPNHVRLSVFERINPVDDKNVSSELFFTEAVN